MDWLPNKNKAADYDLLLDDMINELQEIKEKGHRPPIFFARQNIKNILHFTSVNTDLGFMMHVAINATKGANEIERRNRG